MNDTKIGPRPSLPVSIPIHIYHQALRMASAKSDFNNNSDQQFPIHNEQKENQPKLANMTVDKATLTEDRNETITIESPEDDKCEYKFIAEQFAPNTLVQRDPQTPQTVNYSNDTYNPQSARRFTRTPRPQIMHQHQLCHRVEYIYDYRNKMYRHPGKGNIRPTPYQQKLQKRQTGQQQGIGSIQSVQMQHAYYQANPQQFIHQQMQYQQNFH